MWIIGIILLVIIACCLYSANNEEKDNKENNNHSQKPIIVYKTFRRVKVNGKHRENEVVEEIEVNSDKWEDVQSSVVLSIYYNSEKNLLYVKFKQESIYVYFDVSKNVAEDFLNSSSKGRYVRKVLWDYDYKRLK